MVLFTNRFFCPGIMHRQRRWAALVLILLVALSVTGCGKKEKAEPTAANDLGTAMLEYAQCMRANGVPDFPDPGEDGGIRIVSGPNSKLNANSPAFQAAEKACADKRPSGGEGKRAPMGDVEDDMIAYAKCIRENGVPDFPDPEVNGGRVKMMAPKSAGGKSGALEAAQKACESKLPGAMRQGKTP